MRVLVFPLLAFSTLFSGSNDEPTERQMRGAFEDSLALYVRNALDFAAETGGPAAVARIRAAGTDRFTVNAFRKHDCRRDVTGYYCAFAFDIDLANGPLQRTIGGRFLAGPRGLEFQADV
jgi:hypothetical protein